MCPEAPGRHLTIRSSRARFAASCKFLQVSLAQGRKAARLNSGVRAHMKKIAVIATLLTFAGSSSALDKADEGVFALVHQNGQITQKIARLSHSGERWRIEERKPDGTWQDVTCESACVLEETSQEQVVKFLAGTSLEGRKMECVHDQAFAFCRSGEDPASRAYHMLAFVNDSVIPLKWVRIDETKLPPVSAP